MKSVKFAAVFALFSASFIGGFAQAQSVEQGVIVTGEGHASVPPDMATITLGVSQNAQTAQQVMAQVNGSVAEILAQLQELGVAEKDVQTAGFYLRPQRNQQQPTQDGPRKITGYQGGNSVTVQVRDLEMLGVMMDGVIDLGANDFNGLKFGLNDDTDVVVAARARAVGDAQDRAAQLAQAAGITLGKVTRMSEQTSNAGPRGSGFVAARSSMSEAIASGEVDVRVQVTMVYAIARGDN